LPTFLRDIEIVKMGFFLLKALSFGFLVVGLSGSSPTDGPGLIVKHEGEPTGQIKNINGSKSKKGFEEETINHHEVNIYHANSKEKANDHAILFLTDIYGVALPQNRL
jgi:hypothetical protein